MGQNFELADAQTIEQTADVGYKINFRSQFGFTDSEDEIRFVYRKATQTLYALVAEQTGALHIFKERSFLRDSWQRVSPGGGYPFGVNSGGANINQPLATQEDSLIIPDNGDQIIRRSEDWGETEPNVVYTDANALCTRHSQDAHGDIYFAEYQGPSNGNHDLIKSTDDGQTWTTIANQIGSTHMHFAAPAPRSDLVVFSSGHDDAEMEVCRKNGTDHDNTQLFPNGNAGTQPGSILLMEATGTPNTWSENVRCYIGHDDSRYVVSHTQLGLDDTNTAQSEPIYATTSRGQVTEYQPFIADIDIIDGMIVALDRGGQLRVSPDGYFWETIPVTKSVTGKFMNFFCETENHLIVEGLEPVALPKQRIRQVNPRKQSFTTFAHNPSSPVAAGERLLEHIPIDNCEKIRASGFLPSGETLNIQTWSGDVLMNDYDPLLESNTEDSRYTNEMPLYGQTARITTESGLSDTARWSIELFKR